MDRIQTRRSPLGLRRPPLPGHRFLTCCRRSRRGSHGGGRRAAGSQREPGPFHLFAPEGHLPPHEAQPVCLPPRSEHPGGWGPPYSTPSCAQRSSLARLLENSSLLTLNVFLLCLQKPNPSLPLEPKQCTMEGPGQPPPSLLWCLLPSPSCFPFLFVLLNVKWACWAPPQQQQLQKGAEVDFPSAENACPE